MPQVFGIDMQSIIAEAFAAAGGLTPGTLTKSTPGGRDPDNPTRQLEPSTTTHQLEAAIETRQQRLEGTAVAESELICTILGGSISPPAVPAVNDTLELEGVTYTLGRLRSSDPASAVYEFVVS